jgi:hypothetical protein
MLSNQSIRMCFIIDQMMVFFILFLETHKIGSRHLHTDTEQFLGKSGIFMFPSLPLKF